MSRSNELPVSQRRDTGGAARTGRQSAPWTNLAKLAGLVGAAGFSFDFTKDIRADLSASRAEIAQARIEIGKLQAQREIDHELILRIYNGSR